MTPAGLMLRLVIPFISAYRCIEVSAPSLIIDSRRRFCSNWRVLLSQAELHLLSVDLLLYLPIDKQLNWCFLLIVEVGDGGFQRTWSGDG